jgi:hypothetical protein
VIKRKPLLLAETGATYSGGWQMPLPHAGLQHATTLRDKVAGRYDETAGFTMPGREGINTGPDQGQIYDDTGVIAVPEFASRIQAGIIPNFSKWANFIAGILIEDADQRDELKKALEQVVEYLFEMLNSSNFAVEANECFMDLALGTMCLELTPGSFDNPFNCRAVVLRALKFCIGPDGRPDPIYETRNLPLSEILVHFPKATLPHELVGQDPYAKFDVVEAWHRDWSQPEAIRYRQSVFIPALENRVIFEEWHTGPGCCSKIAARWSKASGEGWGRGPAFNVLPSLRKVNFAEAYLLDHAEMAVAGIWTIDDDGVVNTATVKLEPGTMVPKATGSEGLKNVAPGANFDITQFLLEEARKNIRKALYTEQLGPPEGTPMSATEVQQRMAELARAVGSPFGRLILEFVMPVVTRACRILQDKGLIKMPRVDGKNVKLIATSPLAQAQRFETVDALTKFGAIIQQVFGPQATNVFVDGGEFADELADNMQVPRRVLRPPAQQKQIMEAIAQTASQPQGAPNGSAPAAGDGGGGTA